MPGHLLLALFLAALCSAAFGQNPTFSRVGVHYLQHPENNGDPGPSDKNIPIWYPIDNSASLRKPYTFQGAFPNGTRPQIRFSYASNFRCTLIFRSVCTIRSECDSRRSPVDWVRVFSALIWLSRVASAFLDAPLSPTGPFALAVLSGGVAMLPEAYYGYAEALARQGHVVIGSKPFFELFSQAEWRNDTAGDELGFSYLLYLRQRSLSQAVDLILGASNGSVADGVRKQKRSTLHGALLLFPSLFPSRRSCVMLLTARSRLWQ